MTNSIFTIPNNTRDNEKNTLIARTPNTNSAALASIYEYQFQAVGTKKCQIPKPIEAVMPMATRILIKEESPHLLKRI
jgi:hypothetical protein